jgi:anti-anti-sigma factor
MESVVDTGTSQVSVPETVADHTTLVELHGDIDLEVVEPFRDCVLTGVEQNDDIIVDLTGVTMIDCASLGELVQASHLADRRGRTVSLVAPPPAILRTLAATGLDNAFPVIGERPEALGRAGIDSRDPSHHPDIVPIDVSARHASTPGESRRLRNTMEEMASPA